MPPAAGPDPGVESLRAEVDRVKIRAAEEKMRVDLDKRLEVKEKLPKIGEAGNGAVPFEIEGFEQLMLQLKVDSYELWIRYFKICLVKKMKDWFDNGEVRGRLKECVDACYGPNPTKTDWEDYYFYIAV